MQGSSPKDEAEEELALLLAVPCIMASYSNGIWGWSWSRKPAHLEMQEYQGEK